MNNHSISKIKEKLQELQVDSLAKETGFYLRKPKKITAINFLVSFMQMFLAGNFSLKIWATSLSILANTTVSFQAVGKRLEYKHLAFMYALLQKALTQSFQQATHLNTDALFETFNRVLLEDSSCFKLPQALFHAFPGATSSSGRNLTTGRIQFRMDLKSHSYHSMWLTHYRNNDASYAAEILKVLRTGDLIIRDLGYFKLDIFAKIASLGAFFVSRLKNGILVFDDQSGEQLDFVAYLKKLEAKGIRQLDRHILIGATQKYKVRVIAFKLSAENAEKRVRVAKQARSKKTAAIKPSTLYLLSWNIFITNVKEDTWSCEEVYKAYSLRWHIEIIFKGWKSKFKLLDMMKNCTGKNPAKPEIYLLLFLISIVLLFTPSFHYYQAIILERFGKILSPMKYAGFIKVIEQFGQSCSEELKLELLQRNYCFDKRKDRQNHYEKTYNLKLS